MVTTLSPLTYVSRTKPGQKVWCFYLKGTTRKPAIKCKTGIGMISCSRTDLMTLITKATHKYINSWSTKLEIWQLTIRGWTQRFRHLSIATRKNMTNSIKNIYQMTKICWAKIITQVCHRGLSKEKESNQIKIKLKAKIV